MTKTESSGSRSFFICLVVLGVVLAVLFGRSFLPGFVVFSNDAPFGLMTTATDTGGSNFKGYWQYLNWIGINQPAGMPDLSNLLITILGPVGYAKFHTPIGLLFLGASAWWFCRRSGFAPAVGILTAIAAALNSNPFSYACWGLAGKAIALGAVLIALGALQGTQTGLRAWLWAAVAGFAVGLNVMQAADVGALLSLYVAAFVLFQTLTSRQPQSAPPIATGGIRLALLAACAVWAAAHGLNSFVGTQVKDVAVLQGADTSDERWNYLTSWSFPPSEAVRLLVPGVFGYRMDTPDGGAYWGSVGSDGSPPRFSGSGEYPGLLVVLVGLWAIGRALVRGDRQPFHADERRCVLFWAVAAGLSLLLALGHYTPLYQLLYRLPFFSTMRIPMKFLHGFHLSLIVLFAYGLEGLRRAYLVGPAGRAMGWKAALQDWWKSVHGFERGWSRILVGLAVASVFGALIYSASRQSVDAALQRAPAMLGTSAEIFRHSMREVWIYAFLVILLGGVLATIASGWFKGEKAKYAYVFLGLILAGDLMRADSPWVVYVNYPHRYQANPVVDVLREQPWEQRVTAFLDPRRIISLTWSDRGDIWSALHNLWLEHHFQYYRIETLDIIQLPRMPELDKRYINYFSPTNESTLSWAIRRWELTNTRFLLGGIGLDRRFNAALGRSSNGFQTRMAFAIVPKPNTPQNLGATLAEQLDNLTVIAATNGNLALTEFRGALPRAQLYSKWSVITNDDATLARLRDATFDPHNEVVLSETPAAASVPAETSSGTATISYYRAKHVVVNTQSAQAGVLLLNDRWHPDWVVTVDGKPTRLLRANFIMRGVELPAGNHTVEFRFKPPCQTLYVSLSGLLVGIGLAGWLSATKRTRNEGGLSNEPSISTSTSEKKRHGISGSNAPSESTRASQESSARGEVTGSLKTPDEGESGPQTKSRKKKR